MKLIKSGIYIQSYVETNQTSSNENTSLFLSHEIKTTTAGITKTQIISEDWNGKEYTLGGTGLIFRKRAVLYFCRLFSS